MELSTYCSVPTHWQGEPVADALLAGDWTGQTVKHTNAKTKALAKTCNEHNAHPDNNWTPVPKDNRLAAPANNSTQIVQYVQLLHLRSTISFDSLLLFSCASIYFPYRLSSLKPKPIPADFVREVHQGLGMGTFHIWTSAVSYFGAFVLFFYGNKC